MIDKIKISNFTKTLHKVLAFDKAPYDVHRAIELLNGKLENADLPENTDACIKKELDSFNIYINSTKPILRERFSIAHELGHLFLHMGYLVDQKKWSEINNFYDSIFYRANNNYSIEEYEANEFAASFLMPSDEFKKIVVENLRNGKVNIQPIAQYFGVSEVAASFRGKFLGIFQW
ncbi:MAG: hypothetical protein ACD_59C00004G0001 [uncultured bacterium]|nr:MAG: hypothetical protein ACD_59C00004G0001 [uncultured bacterium]